MLRTLALLTAALTLPATAHAQGFLDRLVTEVSPATVAHDVSPQGLAEQGVFVYDHRSDMANMPFDAIGPGKHMLVLTSLAGGEARMPLFLETGAECVAAAVSYARVHGGGWSFCHPLKPITDTPTSVPEPLP